MHWAQLQECSSPSSTELLNTHQRAQRLGRASRAEQSSQEHPLMGWVGAPLHWQSHSKERGLETTNPCFVTPLQVKLYIPKVWHFCWPIHSSNSPGSFIKWKNTFFPFFFFPPFSPMEWDFCWLNYIYLNKSKFRHLPLHSVSCEKWANIQMQWHVRISPGWGRNASMYGKILEQWNHKLGAEWSERPCQWSCRLRFRGFSSSDPP